jgi:hypothetical protein
MDKTGETDDSTAKVGYFNTLLSKLDQTKQKICKDM